MPGFSGGPLMNSENEIIGINSIRIFKPAGNFEFIYISHPIISNFFLYALNKKISSNTKKKSLQRVLWGV